MKKLGSILNLGWTVGEETLFGKSKKRGEELCRSVNDACVLAISKENLANIKKNLVDRGNNDEFVKIEVVLRGNYLIKKGWTKNNKIAA
jgi:hypothetical protein